MQKILFIIISIIIFPIYAFSNTFNKSKCDFIETNTNIINDIVNNGKTYKNNKINGILCYSEKKVDTIIPIKNGLPHGTGYTYYKNGNVKWETPYENGKINGIEKVYYENGNLKSETVFKNDQIEKEQKHDNQYFYYR